MAAALPLSWELAYAAGVAPYLKKKKIIKLGISLVAEQVKDLALSLQQLGSLLWLRFDP